jgi:hypothetical protein
MTRWHLLFFGLVFLCAIQPRCARADTPAVTADLLCAVKSAIKLHRQPVWTPERCEEVEAALNATPDPRQMAAICTNESDLNERALVEVRPGVYDVGLCGVRCVLGQDKRCTNGPARGYTLAQLMAPVTSIHVADLVLNSHGGSLRKYNGGTREHGYEARIGAIMSALGGVEVRVKGHRMEKLVRQIAKATRP